MGVFSCNFHTAKHEAIVDSGKWKIISHIEWQDVFIWKNMGPSGHSAFQENND